MRPRTIPSPATLDKWDIAFIKHFKSGCNVSMDTLLTIWAERCAVETNHHHLYHVAEHLANLIDRLNLTPDLYTVLCDMDPKQGWRFGLGEAMGYPERQIHVMASWLRLTEVKYLPGYREAVHPTNLERAPARALDAGGY